MKLRSNAQQVQMPEDAGVFIKPGLFLILLIGVMFQLILLTGCEKSDSFIENEVNPQINVFEIKLNMPESKLHELITPKPEKVQCINGYEFEYTDKKINIGINSQTAEVRRVTTKNPQTSIYGITPGVALEKAYEAISTSGFVEDNDSKYKFRKENVILSVISMKGTHADGIEIEIKPD